MIIKLGEEIEEYTLRNKKDEDIPVYSVTNDKGFCTGYFSKDVSSKDQSTYKIVPYGCFAYNPSRINVGSVDWQHCEDKVIVSPLYVVFKVSNKINPQYLYYYLKSDIARTYIKATAAGSVRDNLKFSMLKEFPFNLRTLEEQSKIVKVLERVENNIELCKKRAEYLDTLVKSRFIEMFGDMKLNKRGWKLKSFEELTYLITDGEHATPKRTDKGIYLLSARNILNHSLQLKDVDYINEKEYDRIAKRIIPQEGDILISCSGTVGRCCSVPSGFHFQMVRSVALIRFKEYINPIFAEYMITSDYLQEQINSSKTVSSQANLFQGKIRTLKGFVPPIEMQNEFSVFVHKIDKSKLAVQKSLDELETLKKSLMQEYFG